MFDLRFTYSLLRLQMRIFSSGLVYAKRFNYAQALLAVLHFCLSVLSETYFQRLHPDVYVLLVLLNYLLHACNIRQIQCELDFDSRCDYTFCLGLHALEQYCNFLWCVKKMRNSTTGLMYQRI
jgi:hypothetical protein